MESFGTCVRIVFQHSKSTDYIRMNVPCIRVHTAYEGSQHSNHHRPLPDVFAIFAASSSASISLADVTEAQRTYKSPVQALISIESPICAPQDPVRARSQNPRYGTTIAVDEAIELVTAFSVAVSSAPTSR